MACLNSARRADRFVFSVPAAKLQACLDAKYVSMCRCETFCTWMFPTSPRNCLATETWFRTVFFEYELERMDLSNSSIRSDSRIFAMGDTVLLVVELCQHRPVAERQHGSPGWPAMTLTYECSMDLDLQRHHIPPWEDMLLLPLARWYTIEYDDCYP